MDFEQMILCPDEELLREPDEASEIINIEGWFKIQVSMSPLQERKAVLFLCFSQTHSHSPALYPSNFSLCPLGLFPFWSLPKDTNVGLVQLIV